MAQFIDKDALVAEIKKEIKDIYVDIKYVGIPSWEEGVIDGLEKAIEILDILEVKDVDLELNSFDAIVCKIGNASYLKEMDKDAIAKVLEPYKDEDKVKVIIKAQKGE